MASKLTAVQLRALAQWQSGQTSIYHAGGVRQDVGERLLSLGMIEPAGRGFPPRFSICVLTEKGRAALALSKKDETNG